MALRLFISIYMCHMAAMINKQIQSAYRYSSPNTGYRKPIDYINTLRLSDQYMLFCLTGAQSLSKPVLVNWILRNKIQWNFSRNSCICIYENAVENVVWKMAAILSRPHWVKCDGIKMLFGTYYTLWHLFHRLVKLTDKMDEICNNGKFSVQEPSEWRVFCVPVNEFTVLQPRI